MITYTLTILKIKRESCDTITLCFKQPSLRKIKYRAGQYLTLIFRINGRRYLRPYSFSSSPAVDSSLDVTIKRVPNGLVSNHVHDRLSEGDSVEVLAPMGDFVFEGNDIDKVFLWGGGSGITPLISLLKDILSNHAGVTVKLIYCNRDYDNVIFQETIEELSVKYSDRLGVYHFITQPAISEEDPNVVRGRLSEPHIRQIMDNASPHDNSAHFICGPNGLRESIKEVLSLLGTPNDRISTEEFELIKDPRDFDGISTQEVKLNWAGQSYSLEVVKGKSVLDSALDAGIELPYSCQTGNCSTCRARLLSGELRMIGLKEERTDLLPDDYLLCCSHPLTNDVSLEIIENI